MIGVLEDAEAADLVLGTIGQTKQTAGRATLVEEMSQPTSQTNPTPSQGIPAWVIVAGTILALGLIIGVAGFSFLAGKAQPILSPPTTLVPEPEEFVRVSPVTVETIRSLAELTTVEVVSHTTIEKGTDSGWLNWATGDQLTLFVLAEIGAGVDLAGLGTDAIVVNEQAASVTITLPPAQILYIAVDNDATHVYDRDTGLFTRADPNLERSARQVAEEVLQTQALEGGLLVSAEDGAVSVLTDFLSAMGYESISINFTD